MDGYRSSETARPRGPRIGLLIAMIALGLVAGIALTVVAMRRVHWATSTTTTVAAAAPSGGSNFTPAPPLGPGDSAATPPPADPAVLATREATLAAQLAALESRLAGVTVDAGTASGQAARAESMLVAVAARRAIDHGAPLGYLEEQLRTRFGQSQPRAVAIVIQAARTPVTLADLRHGLDAIGETIATGRGDASWGETIDRLLSNLVILRRAGTPSPLPVDRLAVARHLLEGGQVEAARADVARLQGAGDVGGWMTAARRYVLARQALDAIDNAAIIGPPVPAATPAPSVTTTTAPVSTGPVANGGAAPVVPTAAPITTSATAAVPPMAGR